MQTDFNFTAIMGTVGTCTYMGMYVGYKMYGSNVSFSSCDTEKVERRIFVLGSGAPRGSLRVPGDHFNE